mgnify:FL=1
MPDNNIFIGGKPFMNYVTGVVMQFTTKNADDVIIKARASSYQGLLMLPRWLQKDFWTIQLPSRT